MRRGSPGGWNPRRTSALPAPVALALGQGAKGAEVAVAGPNLDLRVQEQSDSALDDARGAVQVAAAGRAEGAGTVKAVGHARAPSLSQKQGAVWASRQQPWELRQLISLITEVISHRPVRSFAFSASREGGGMYTQLNVYIGVQLVLRSFRRLRLSSPWPPSLRHSQLIKVGV